jgi:hypothetical protein
MLLHSPASNVDWETERLMSFAGAKPAIVTDNCRPVGSITLNKLITSLRGPEKPGE